MADRYQNRAYSQDQNSGHASQQSSEGDPLAELARLIGQADPNSNFGRESRGPAPSRDTSFIHHDDNTYAVAEESALPPPGPPSWMQRVREQQSHEQPQSADEAAYQSLDHSKAHQVDPARYDDVLYAQGDDQSAHGQDQYGQYAPPLQLGDSGYDDEPEQKPRRSGLLTVAMVLALGVVGTAGAFAYRSFTGPRTGEPPVIKADTGPTKIVPPTQTADASGKLIYDRIGAGGAERVVPREEQPLDVKGNSGARVVLPPMGQQSANAAQAAIQPSARGAAPAAQSEEPRKVRTLSIRPDQPESTPAAPPAKQAARAPAPQSANASTGNGPVSLSPPGQQPQAAPVRTTSTAPTAGSGAFVVQVSSQRSEADAQSSYRALQGKYPSVLGSRQAAIRKADLGDKGTYYRAMVGPFSSSEEATRLCESLKSAGGQCNVMRN